MSDGLARVAGGGVPFVFNGETMIFHPLVMKDYATIEQYILSKRPNPLDKVKEMLPGLSIEVQKHLLDLAYSDMKHHTTVSPTEVESFMQTTEGIAMAFWLVTERNCPGKYKFEQVKEIVDKMTPEEVSCLGNVRDQAAGTDELGN